MEVEPFEDLKRRILETAKEVASMGAGHAQERVVLRRIIESPVGEELTRAIPERLKRERLILTAWHDLFREGELAWGYSVDNPNTPFFHVPDRALSSSHSSIGSA